MMENELSNGVTIAAAEFWDISVCTHVAQKKVDRETKRSIDAPAYEIIKFTARAKLKSVIS